MFNSLYPSLTRASGELFCRTSHQHQLYAACRSFSHTAVLSQEAPYSCSFKTLEVMTVGKIRVIGINRPRHRNAVNRQVARELYRAFRLFDKDEDVSVGILYGKGGTFCAGYDLKEISRVSEKQEGTTGDVATVTRGQKNDQTGMRIQDLLQECDVENDIAPMGPSRMLLSKPVIAAVSGYAVAGGLELALLCDLRIVEEEAVFGVFCRRFGVPLIDGGTVRLPALIGLSRALDMILTGRPVSAKEALSMGLANRVVPQGKSLDEALLLANQIAAFPQECLKADRMSAYHSSYHHVNQTNSNKNWLKQALSYEFTRGVKVLGEESVPGARKFVQGVGRKGQFGE